MLNVPITPPRVPFIDQRTGNVAREWYLFFLSLYQITENNSDVIDTNPDVAAELASVQHEQNKELQALEQQPSPPQLGTMAPMNKEFMDYIGWNQNAGVAVTPGQMAWNSADGTLDIGMGFDSVVQQVGLETYYRVKATADITNGQCVMYDGTLGASTTLLAKPSITSLTDGRLIMGVATMDIANGEFGYITAFGIVRGINATGSAVGETWADGDLLYYNKNYTGALTNVLPVAPADAVIVAAVVNAGAGSSGSLFIRVNFLPHLRELSDVYISSVATNDTLIYNAAQTRWENKAPTAARDALGLGTGNPTNGQMLIGNGTDFTTASLTAGSNVTITPGSGSVTIAASSPSPFGSSTVSGTSTAIYSGTLPTGSAASTNTWTKVTIGGSQYWIPIWAV